MKNCHLHKIQDFVQCHKIPVFSADLPDVQFSILNTKLTSHPKICSQFPSLSPFQSGKHFELISNSKNTICTNICLSSFSVWRYENGTTVFKKKVFSGTQIENRLIFTTMTLPKITFYPMKKLKCKGQRSSRKLEQDLLDKSVTLATFKSKKEL